MCYDKFAGRQVKCLVFILLGYEDLTVAHPLSRVQGFLPWLWWFCMPTEEDERLAFRHGKPKTGPHPKNWCQSSLAPGPAMGMNCSQCDARDFLNWNFSSGALVCRSAASSPTQHYINYQYPGDLLPSITIILNCYTSSYLSSHIQVSETKINLRIIINRHSYSML